MLAAQRDSNPEMAPCSYSIPRPNPFLGTLQVLEIAGARAISPDGVNWEIQVASEGPANLWASLNRGRRATEFFTFGVWSREKGVARVPLNPLFDIGVMLEESERLVEQLKRGTASLPFPPSAGLELWLLGESDAKPLAMLAFARDEETRQATRRGRWTAAPRGDNGFKSASAEARGIPGSDPANPRRHLELLEQAVARRAGAAQLSQWIRRGPDGSGVGLPDQVPDHLAGQELPPDTFPELLVCEDWADQGDRALVADYTAWRSVRLLTLSGLSNATRARMERAACRRASAVDRLWRVYPKIIDRGLIEAARVEARLRRAHTGTD